MRSIVQLVAAADEGLTLDEITEKLRAKPDAVRSRVDALVWSGTLRKVGNRYRLTSKSIERRVAAQLGKDTD